MWARILTGLLVLVFLASGSSKLAGTEQMVANFRHFGFPWWFLYFTGAVEVFSAIGLLFYKNRIGFFSAALLTITMIVAAGTHLMTDPFPTAIPAMILAILTGLIAFRRRDLLADHTAAGEEAD